MFALRHVIWQLRVLRLLRFVPPCVLMMVTWLALVSAVACHPIKASDGVVAAKDHKSLRVTGSDNNESDSGRQGVITPRFFSQQWQAQSAAAALIRKHDDAVTDNTPLLSSRTSFDLDGDNHNDNGRNNHHPPSRLRRHALDSHGQLEYYPSDRSGLTNLRKFLNYNCVQFSGGAR